jgi:hypothetical protein
MAVTYIPTGGGSLVVDDSGQLVLTYSASDRETTLTVTDEPNPGANSGYTVFKTWKFVSSDIAQLTNARLRHSLNFIGAPSNDSKLRFYSKGDAAGPMPVNWTPHVADPLGDAHVDGAIGFLPPANAAPANNTRYVSLVKIP